MRIDAELLRREIEGMKQAVANNKQQLEYVKSVVAKSEGALTVLEDMLTHLEKPEFTPENSEQHGDEEHGNR